MQGRLSTPQLPPAPHSARAPPGTPFGLSPPRHPIRPGRAGRHCAGQKGPVLSHQATEHRPNPPHRALPGSGPIPRAEPRSPRESPSPPATTFRSPSDLFSPSRSLLSPIYGAGGERGRRTQPLSHTEPAGLTTTKHSPPPAPRGAAPVGSPAQGGRRRSGSRLPPCPRAPAPGADRSPRAGGAARRGGRQVALRALPRACLTHLQSRSSRSKWGLKLIRILW